MDRILVVVFDNESKAYEGTSVLRQLNSDAGLTVFASAVVVKNADGTATVKQDDWGPLGTLVGTAWGTLLGLLGGPVGLALGVGVGLVAGVTADLSDLRIGEDFIADVTKELRPGRVAVVAEVDEDWTTPVDSRMEAIGGTVLRRTLSDVKSNIRDEHVAAMKADIAQLRAEHGEARAERKAKLHEKINQLDAKLQAQLQKAKDRREAAEREAKAKAEVLKAKAATLKSKAAETHV
jgi:uncharacterized membrane protein